MSGRWPVTHVGIKSRKGIIPSLTNDNAALAVQVKAFVARVIAPVFHIGPYFIYGRATHHVSPARIDDGFSKQTSARFDIAGGELANSYGRVSSALTYAEPLNLIGCGSLNWSYRCESVKRHSANIFSVLVQIGYNFISHFVTSNNNVIRGGVLPTSRTRILTQVAL